MRRALVAPVMALVVSISALTASSSKPSGVGDPFATRATSVCRTALEAKQAWSEFPVANFDPSHSDPSAFPEVAAWLEDEVTPTFEAWLAGLTALGTPPSGRKAWSDVLSAVESILELNADEVAAAKSDDTHLFVEARDGLEGIQPELVRATAAVGVATCADVHA
jgi:hypothetical protein